MMETTTIIGLSNLLTRSKYILLIILARLCLPLDCCIWTHNDITLVSLSILQTIEQRHSYFWWSPFCAKKTWLKVCIMCGYLSTRWLFIYLSVHPVATLNWFKHIYDICSVRHSRANRPVKTWSLSITIEDHDVNNPCAAVFDKLKKAVQDYFNEGGQCPKKIGLTFTSASRDKITRYEQQH